MNTIMSWSPSYLLRWLVFNLTWLREAVGSSMRTIAVVRDPRAWIYSLIRDDLPPEIAKRQISIRLQLLSNATCHPPTILPLEFRNLQKYETVERLAEVWNASIAAMVRNGRHIQLVRFEDLVSNPQFASVSIMQRLRMTIAVPQINRLIRTVRSNSFTLPYEPHHYISSSSLHNWKENLKSSDVETIELICGEMMDMLGYL